MQRAFELFHEERAAELNTLKQQFQKQENESTLALNECKKAFNEARESEKAAMDALNVVTERERVVGIELKSVQEEVRPIDLLRRVVESLFTLVTIVD